MATPLQNGPQGHQTTHESAFVRMRRKITESRYFMVSLLVHAIVVIIAGSLVIVKSLKPDEDFVPVGGVAIEENTLTLNEETTIERLPDTQIASPKLPNPGGNPPDVVTADFPETPFKWDNSPSTGPIVPKPPGMPDPGPIKTPGAIDQKGIPTVLICRIGDGKITFGKKLGMSDKAIPAVQRSLKWLRENQNEDGSWGDSNKGAMTGLALLCYLGFGELPESKEYGYTINRAVGWLLENGTKFEGRLGMEAKFSQHGVYSHGIATYALGEYYALTHDDRVKELLAKAVIHIVRGQGPGGGWMYGFDKTADDLSVSGWQIQALKAAHLSKLDIYGVDEALDKAMAMIERFRGPKGGYGYRGPEDRYSLTGVGILTKLFWKGDRAELRQGMEWLIAETEKGKPVKYNSPSADLYAWYYHTQACLMFGGSAWTKWNRWFQDEIINAQNPDGSWPVAGAKGHGPQSENTKTGAVYRTTLCTLMLEVFYRYTVVHK